MTYQKKKINNLILFFIIFFGCVISYIRASNFSDGDSYSVILAFLNIIDGGNYTPSRGAYGHPVPEFLIGFFSYFFGTPFSNIFCFLLFFVSMIILFKTFCKSETSLSLFLCLVFSNFYLLFENTNSIDYPIAMFFFSLGLYFLKNEKYFISFIFFGITIGSRANFLTFVYPSLMIYFYNEWVNLNFKNILYSFFTVTVVGLFFYIPLFILHNFSIDFLDLPFLKDNNDDSGWYGGPKLTFESLTPRFLYKVYLILGIYSWILYILFFKNIIKKLNFYNRENLILIFIIFINLFVFFFMPTKLLIINPFIIFFYLICFNTLKNSQIIFLILFNMLQWFLTYEVADITYKNKDICLAKNAIKYELKFSINHGKFYQEYFINEDMTKCYSPLMGKYSNNFTNGKPLILSNLMAK